MEMEIAERLSRTVSELRRSMSNLEFRKWVVKIQRENMMKELAAKSKALG
jgi:hypothetical protein